MTTPHFTPVTIERDRWQRPLIIPPRGGTAQAYTRVTTLVGVIDDMSNLMKWKSRMTAVGLAKRSDLMTGVKGFVSDPDAHKKQLDKLCEQAQESAGSTAKATIGTALHAFVERINRGETVDDVPDEYRLHIEAYRRATVGIKPVFAEVFTVCDQWQAAGTPDIIAQVDGYEGMVVCDLKTGPNTIAFGSLKTAMQMAVYAHSVLYTPDGTRTPIAGLRTDIGIVIELNSETGECKLHKADLTRAWDAIPVAYAVRSWRKQKGLLTPMGVHPTLPESAPVAQSIAAAIEQATCRDELLELWAAADAKGAWTPDFTEAAKRRLDALAHLSPTTTKENSR